jgi:hypothetical protein
MRLPGFYRFDEMRFRQTKQDYLGFACSITSRVFVEAILVVAAVVDCGQLSLPAMASGE